MRKVTSFAVSVVVVAAGAAFMPTGASAASPASGNSLIPRTTTPRALGLGTQEMLTERGSVRGADGTTHTRYDRSFAGLRVIGGDMIVHTTASGAVPTIDKAGSGQVAVASTTPRLSAGSVRGFGLTAARTFAHGDGSALASVVKTQPQAELVVYAAGPRPVLAYDVVTVGVRADQTPSRIHTVVSAASGQTLTSWDEIQTGTGHSIYSGDVTLGTTYVSGVYQLKDNSRGGLYTTDLNGSVDPVGSAPSAHPAGTLFTDTDDVWGNGAISSRQSAAVDAHYGSQMTWDYYKTVLGRSGIFNDGKGTRSRVHYGNGFVNAFWDGATMAYGDGANNAHPLIELDVTGHEMSHGLAQATARLIYTGDAGGLNESNSDIFGTAVEWYANNRNDVPDYLIGEVIDFNGNGKPLRYMDNPFKDGKSPNCWSSNTKTLDPHQSSGVGNHFFYLASEGSGAKTINGVAYNSPTCNSSIVTGAGRRNLEKIWYKALTTYMVSTETYQQARDATIRAAGDLFGLSSAQCLSVENAWKAVSVPAGSYKCTAPTTPPATTAPSAGANLLVNPGFESGQNGWTGTTGPITTDAGRPARTGSAKLWLGGNGSLSTEYEAQSVAIPATAKAATLTFWVAIDSAETARTADDTMKVQGISEGAITTLSTYSNLNKRTGYVQKSVNLIAYKGKTVQLKFVSTEDSAAQTSFIIDDTAVAVS